MNIAISRERVADLSAKLRELGIRPDSARRHARKVLEAKALMWKNLVEVRFFRKDGRMVTKIATMNPAFLPEGKHAIRQNDDPRVVTFWSVNDDGYRCFLAENFVGVVGLRNIRQLAVA